MHLKQPGHTYSACRSFTKNKERIQKFKETAGSRYIFQSELHKDRFHDDMDYGSDKGSDKILHDKTFNIDLSKWSCFDVLYKKYILKTKSFRTDNYLKNYTSDY